MRKIFPLLLIVVALGIVQAAEAQSLAEVPRIGFLTHRFSPGRFEAFLKRLRELGYVEGENIIIEMRDTAGKRKRLPSLAADLVRLKVDVIVATSEPVLRAAMKATKTIPIVMRSISDPVRGGWVASLARPGGNVTGVTNVERETMGKRVELIKETVPRLSRAAFLVTPTVPLHKPWFKEMEMVARSLGVKLQMLEMRKPHELPALFSAARKGGAGALITMRSKPLKGQNGRIAELAIKHRLPAISSMMRFVKVGGLMSYGNHGRDTYRRLATYVHRILKGAKPANLPVERLFNLKLAINLKTARKIDLTIPRRVLLKANEVIE